jgi:FtsH-binding integral membrane protein
VFLGLREYLEDLMEVGSVLYILVIGLVILAIVYFFQNRR